MQYKIILKRISLVCFGFFCTLLIVETILLFANIALIDSNYVPHKPSENNKGKYRILTIGESTTASTQSYMGKEFSYPYLLQQELDKQFPSKYKVYNEAIPATNTGVIASRFKGLILNYKPHIIISMLGINDDDLTPAPDGSFYSRLLVKIRYFRTFKLLKLLYYRLIPSYKKNSALVAKIENIIQLNNLQEYLPQKMINYLLFYQSTVEYLLNGENSDAQGKIPEIQKLMFELSLTHLPPHNLPNTKEIISLVARGDFEQARRKLPKNKTYSTLIIKSIIELLRKDDFLIPHELILASKIAPNSVAGTNTRKRNIIKKALKKDPSGETLSYLLHAIFPNDLLEGISIAQIGFNIAAQTDNTTALNNISEILFQYYQDDLLERLCAKNNINIPSQDRPKSSYYTVPSITAANYQGIAKEAIDNNIVFIAMQYPLLPLGPLKELLGKLQPKITFVSNQNNFLNELESYSVDKIFIDLFAKSFGHCNRKGNMLIVKNLVPTIRQVTKKIPLYSSGQEEP